MPESLCSAANYLDLADQGSSPGGLTGVPIDSGYLRIERFGAVATLRPWETTRERRPIPVRPALQVASKTLLDYVYYRLEFGFAHSFSSVGQRHSTSGRESKAAPILDRAWSHRLENARGISHR
jgi:hypothetical protein